MLLCLLVFLFLLVTHGIGNGKAHTESAYCKPNLQSAMLGTLVLSNQVQVGINNMSIRQVESLIYRKKNLLGCRSDSIIVHIPMHSP